MSRPAVAGSLADRVLEAGGEVVNDVVTLRQGVLGGGSEEDGGGVALSSEVRTSNSQKSDRRRSWSLTWERTSY